MIVDIKDIYGNTRFSTPINKGSKRKFMLMQEDYITLKFSTDTPVYFGLGDGIDNELGIYELVDLYKPVYNSSTGGYDYELRLDAYYWKWKNKKFFYLPEDVGREASWNLTATLDVHLNVFLDNLKTLGYKFREEEFIFEIDDTVANASKLVSYNNVNLIDALTQMAEAWECEWWMENHKIRFGRCEFSSPVDFKAGDLLDTENVNVNSMQRSDSQTKYATRVYAFGSTRNIPESYRKSLIFDVKEVKGRDISDTERMLRTAFFPSGVVTKEEYAADINLGTILNANNRELSHDEKLADKLNSNSYRVVDNGSGIRFGIGTFYTSFPVGGVTSPRDYLPAGDYVLKASFIYMLAGIEKEMSIGSNTISVGENQQYEIALSFSLPDNFTLGMGVSQLRLRTYMLIPYYNLPFIGLGVGMSASVSFDMALVAGQSADTSVIFLSGTNTGKIFDAIYNPDFLTGDKSNVIRLPEGVTASLGDRYTINNIIKGKVPDNYFSKDDKELVLNGVVQKRLMLPEGVSYIDAYKYSPAGERIDIGDERYDNPDNVEMRKEEAIEEVVVFEDEYPKYIGNTIIVPEPEWEKDKENDKDTDNKKPVYSFKDTGIKNFNKEDFVIDELRLIFQTGKLAGLDFAVDVTESDDTGTTFKILPNKDYGRYLPDNVLFPQAAHTEDDKIVPADTYILHGFDTAYISEQMLPDSEHDLLKRAKEYVSKSMIDPSTYNCEMDSIYIYNEGNIRTFEVGDKVNLINKAYFPEGRLSRIIGFEWPLDIPYDHPTYVVGETSAYSRIGEIEGKIDSLTYKGQTYSGMGTIGGGGSSVYVIGVNDKTLPSDRNTFSSKRIINEIKERSISRINDDIVAGHIDFEKGLVSQELIEADNGLVVRRKELVEATLMSIVEEGEDSLVEELSIVDGGVSTLGELKNVSDEVDDISDTTDILVRQAGAQEWTINTTLFTQVAQMMEKIFPLTITLTGGGVFEKGSSQTINLAWIYDREIDAQSINKESLAIGVYTKQYSDVTVDTDYTLRVVYKGETYSKSVSALFKLKMYYGVSEKESLTNEEILSLSSVWTPPTQGAIKLDCAGGKYPYYILPTSMATDIEFWIGGLRNTDWVSEVMDVTNASGYTESYTIFRLNSIQTGVLNIEVK